MHSAYCTVLFLFLLSCNSQPRSNETVITDTLNSSSDSSANSKNIQDTTLMDAPYAWRYVIIADTSTQYFSLEKEGKRLAGQLQSKFIKYHLYNKEAGLHDDTVNYWYNWRRQYGEPIEAKDITVEYLRYYTGTLHSSNTMMAIVVAIFDTKMDALIYLEKVKKYQPKAFHVAVNMFIGCRS